MYFRYIFLHVLSLNIKKKFIFLFLFFFLYKILNLDIFELLHIKLLHITILNVHPRIVTYSFLCNSIVVQILAMIWLVVLAFPQGDWSFSSKISTEISDKFNFAPSTSTSTTTQRTTTNCPCIATAEYNPICGTDNVTYWNTGRFNCAKNCNPRKLH